MEKLIITMLLLVPAFTMANERTLDERCSGHAEYVVKLLKNKYEGESLKDQLELVDEWSDPVYREQIKNILQDIIYKLPVAESDKDLHIQYLENYTGAYRGCVKQYAKN